jgi:hypothetical protein
MKFTSTGGYSLIQVNENIKRVTESIEKQKFQVKDIQVSSAAYQGGFTTVIIKYE